MAKKRWICYHCRKMNPIKKRKCQYCGEWKVPSKPKLKKKLDRVFSKYIRARDNYRCVTCGKKGNQAGHDATEVDLVDVIDWVKENKPELLNE